ncbi:GNAT family N-acetyltransferase [Gemella palaticanis]|uniref:GNAT family N-acetyltransferase n=2 Tax=Gemelliphila palaticanis TaxID=81950 RepID=A0ABX2SY65_9BACL|nr:GNAT family N-acetyltransferase [Gemella palaticanis]MBF0715253.1 GNAT family N-acetyltransferase [Gemella palaticanis]NYS47183.1 GNAT family N-acetyltransferase [Gemella palaticanis]
MLENAIKNSLYLEAAYFNDELIGLIRVVGDGYSIVYIQDILVKQHYQRKGIGKRLIVDVITKYKNVYQKVLLTDNTEKTKLFYESIGFQEVSSIDCISFIKY